mgnify:CR=1 FL=1
MESNRRDFLKQTGILSGGLLTIPSLNLIASYKSSSSELNQTDSQLPFRQVHLDFHTSKDIENIGKNFNADSFVSTLKKARVNSVTCFGRCHHGFIYYDTKRFPERRHPHLDKGLNLLNEQIKICHENNIRVPIYLTVQWDHYTALQHPEWLILKPDGEPVGTPLYEAGFYRRLCVNSPYRDLLKENILDLFENVSAVDGIFLDITHVVECSCSYCRNKMIDNGLEPSNQKQRRQFAAETMNQFREEIYQYIRTISSTADIFFNSGHVGPYITDSIDHYTHLELESLPGGNWGYIHFPVTSRYARTLNKEFLGMTGKFHTVWGDFHSYKNLHSLEYECFISMAMGGKCSIGDQMYPTGEIDVATYDLIGKVYKQVEEKEPWCKDSVPVTEIAVITPEAIDPNASSSSQILTSIKGVLRMLQESKKQFNIIDFDQDFADYQLVILPDEIILSSEQAEKIRNYLENGGKVLASFNSGMNLDKSEFIIPLGVEKTSDGPVDNEGDYAVGKIYKKNDYAEYIRPEDNEIGEGLTPVEHVMYIKGIPVKSTDGSMVKANTIRSYFDRSYKHFCSHLHTPSSGEVSHPAIVETKNSLYFSHPICTQYAHNAPSWCKTFFNNAVNSLLDNELIKMKAPSTVICTINQQNDNYILHLLHYIPEKRGENFEVIEDVIPLYKIPVSVRFPRKAKKVQLVPEKKEIKFEMKDNHVEFTIPAIEGHQMIEIS